MTYEGLVASRVKRRWIGILKYEYDVMETHDHAFFFYNKMQPQAFLFYVKTKNKGVAKW